MKPRKNHPSGGSGLLRHERGPTGLIDVQGLTSGHRTALWTVIAITAAMFVVETVAGHLCGSHALRADALDFLDDALVYSLSLAMVGRSIRTGAAAAAFNAIIMCAVSLWVLSSAVYHFLAPELPNAGMMGLVSGLGVLANLACIKLLAPHTGERRTFRIDAEKDGPDIVGNVAVVVTAGVVWLLQSPWPDLLVAVLASAQLLWLAFLMLRSALPIYWKNATDSGRRKS